MKPLRTLDSVETPDGVLALKSRGPKDFLITVDGRVLMTSAAHMSEVVLGRAACAGLATHAAPKVLVGGLGMGFTLRAVLDALPPGARVTVAELNEVVAGWCDGPLAPLTDHATADARVQLRFLDVLRLLKEGPKYDAVVLDLYVGPGADTKRDDPLYGDGACAAARRALHRGGVFGVWGEAFDEAYVKRLEKHGFEVRVERPGHGGLRHVVYLGTAR